MGLGGGGEGGHSKHEVYNHVTCLFVATVRVTSSTLKESRA